MLAISARTESRDSIFHLFYRIRQVIINRPTSKYVITIKGIDKRSPNVRTKTQQKF